ncbi:hypothetical protein [Nostoc sp. 'Peltigera membranacea cyanobiont' 232]|uniref:hypothetical protein n=1 Tax=Nostoc sp. 'Peltigera membranacea cyanobiont' 232 TaxID=2014531 RepID=UPI001674FFA6|nr:hypothetical protein [Nostoc sp. 'Peltigera membranacea cyanobiont' 232]
MNFQAALTLNKFITSAADKPGCTLSQQPPAAKLARMTDPVWQNPQFLQLQNT